MATTTTSSKSQQQQFKSPQEALTHIYGGGAQMLTNAWGALDQLRDLVSRGVIESNQALEIVEPVARAIGWAEALVFEQATDGPAVASFGGNGGQQGRN